MRLTEFARTKLQGVSVKRQLWMFHRGAVQFMQRRRANRIRDDKEPKSVVRELAAV